MQAPSKIKLHRDTAELEIQFGIEHYRLSAEFLRVHSSSAEVKGHGPDQAKLQFGKRDVSIKTVEPVGNYGIRLIFSDGHDSGIYTWKALRELGEHRDQLWREYLQALELAGVSRDPHTSAVRLT
ncbi:gamma-butyrobetaine hydroxylase-like domain-containing protein [Gilvimarinus xylanilyticus]|uniref:DUF971 domain-containing protein n=1 Tax=Gilvimarinus xylanilyticus TaxID=2944139 RepID=A0A9X2I683_9GAMM|nr:DUF971 domain-containing protein [Gilvimarinus xylanilyticus]MCP8900726.1 DUF971 domain-containing protein [Gilvimarinus xylanilyticus]